MSYLYRHVRSRESSPLYFEDSDPVYSPRPLVRYNTKRQRADVYSGTDDDGHDDYPRGATPNKSATTTSRALTVRRPSQLERFNVFNDYNKDKDDAKSFHHIHEDSHHHRSKHVHKYYVSRSRSRPPTSDDSDNDSDRKEREFRLKIKAALGRPRRPSHSHSERQTELPMAEWSGDMFRRREKWERVDWESDGYAGADFWDDESDTAPVREVVRYRKVKRSRTDEWRPLAGFRRC